VEPRDLSQEQRKKKEKPEIGMSLVTPESVWNLQRSLAAKAKGSPTLRFYSLYDKICREDVLAHAYGRCKANGGSPGVDGQTFGKIESEGRSEWLDRLREELKQKEYKPGAVKRVWIPKSDGKRRPLGIPRIRDRVVQMAAVIVLEAIFEEDFPDEQYGYRPGRSAHEAIRSIHRGLNGGRSEVVDADLSGYFDSIPHHELMKSVARRVSDGAVLKLIREWLEMPVEETDERGNKKRTTVNKDTGRGTPQGAPISPLLANLYMRRFILGWKKQRWEGRFDAQIVNYADDFVILCRYGAEEARQRMQSLMNALKLTVNETKTKVCRVPEESFDFLGYTIGQQYSAKGGRPYIGTRPSPKRIQRFCNSISEMTERNTLNAMTETLVQDMNLKLRGWANYFCLGAVSKAYKAVDSHARFRLRQWLRRKHKKKGAGSQTYSDEYLYERLGLVRLEGLTKNHPWAKVA
jgi:group II intron reverse transcriptase/maturase